MTTVSTLRRPRSDGGEPTPHRHVTEATPRPRRCVPDVLLIVACGVLLVVLAYDRGRAGLGFTTPLYWSGQILIFAIVAYRVLSRSTAVFDREALVLVYAAAQSVIRWAYSPHAFTFSDELQHFRALNNVLETSHLFNPNYSLPISSRYPGLENVAAELVQVSSIGPFMAGVTVAGVTHVMGAACILLLFREISRSSHIACIGALIYLLNPHAAYFNTSFLYETLALPFTVLSILFALRFATRPSERNRNFHAFLACTSIVVMTHHVSAIATAALVAIVAVATVFFNATRGFAVPLAFCAGVATLVVAGWVFAVAPVTLEYLGVPAQQFLGSLAAITQFAGEVDLPASPTPLFDRSMAPAGVLVTLGLITTNLKFMRGRRPLERCWSWIALALYLLATGTRVLISNGAELSGRLLTFAALFSALAVGTALWRIAGRPGPRFVAVKDHAVTATAIAVVLLLGSIPTSLPPWWQRIPGQFRIEGFASGIDSVGMSRAEWAAAHLPPGARYLGDITSLTLLATIAGLDPIKDPGSVYYSPTLTAEDVAHIKSNSATYLDLDTRISEELPIVGKYFPEDVMSGEIFEPIDAAALRKFDHIVGISRIYDSGYARLYDLRGGEESPYAR